MRSPIRVAAITTLGLLATGCGGGTVTSPKPIVEPPVNCSTTPPSSYYERARNQCGPALLTAIQATIGNQRVLGYTFARDSLYAFIDKGDRTWIMDLYTGREAVGVNTRATAAQNGINTEHIWPRSRGAENDPALSDLHHLFSSDEEANSKRSNYPFGLVRGTVLWTSNSASGQPNDVSKLGYASGNSGQIVFEPRPQKRGDIARAILYFVTRYNSNRPSGYSLQNFVQERDILVAWSREDPPDSWERARNDGVFRAQGNRNPFIDWPQLVDLISFPIN